MNNSELIITGNNLRENRFFILKFLIVWPTLILTSCIILPFIEIFHSFFNLLTIIPILPFLVIVYFGSFILSLVFFAKLYLILFNLIHKPKEGFFKISVYNKDYYFYYLRKVLKEFVIKIFDYFPLPWSKVLPLKLFNIKLPSSAGVLDSYIDSDFIEFGEEAILGEGSIVMSSIVVGDRLLVKKTIIEDRVTIGAYSVVAPGTIAEEGSILGMGSYTKINQRLEKNWIYVGRPAKKLKEIIDDFNQD
ncbi:MAG: hypothetical protein KGD63_05485 [Candidatus Lokiarchaeota archaeon]|nr:hypothetical protein [Candidatus Lokiarchaeota archaeon]